MLNLALRGTKRLSLGINNIKKRIRQSSAMPTKEAIILGSVTYLANSIRDYIISLS